MPNILWIIGGILFFCFGLVVVYLSGQDINRMMKISMLELCLAIPISIILWIFESYKMNNWNIFADKYSIILIYFLVFNIVLLLIFDSLYKWKDRKNNISYYHRKPNGYFSSENAAFRVFTFSFVTVLAGTIWITYSIITNYK